jgi:hypothetical protein
LYAVAKINRIVKQAVSDPRFKKINRIVKQAVCGPRFQSFFRDGRLLFPRFAFSVSCGEEIFLRDSIGVAGPGPPRLIFAKRLKIEG